MLTKAVAFVLNGMVSRFPAGHVFDSERDGAVLGTIDPSLLKDADDIILCVHCGKANAAPEPPLLPKRRKLRILNSREPEPTPLGG